MSEQHPYGDGTNPYQPPPGGGYPPPSPTSGSGYQQPGQGGPSGGAFPPPTSGPGYAPTSGAGYPPAPDAGYQPTSGAGYQPTSGAGYQPTSGAGYPPTSGAGFPSGPGYPPGGPGFDPNAQPFGAAPGAPLPPMTPGRSNPKLKIILAAAGAVLLLLCIGGVIFAVTLAGDNVSDAKAGDCLSGKSIDQSSDRFQEAELEVVECSGSDAKYKVVGRVDDKTQAQATDDVCRQFTGAELIYWEGKPGEEGTVLCLQTNK